MASRLSPLPARAQVLSNDQLPVSQQLADARAVLSKLVHRIAENQKMFEAENTAARERIGEIQRQWTEMETAHGQLVASLRGQIEKITGQYMLCEAQKGRSHLIQKLRVKARSLRKKLQIVEREKREKTCELMMRIARVSHVRNTGRIVRSLRRKLDGRGRIFQAFTDHLQQEKEQVCQELVSQVRIFRETRDRIPKVSMAMLFHHLERNRLKKELRMREAEFERLRDRCRSSLAEEEDQEKARSSQFHGVHAELAGYKREVEAVLSSNNGIGGDKG